MSIVNLVHNQVSFNEWANRQLANWLNTLDIELLYLPVESSFKSLDYTIQHINRTQKFWLKFITQQNITSFDWSVNEGIAQNNLLDLMQKSLELKQAVLAYSEIELMEKLNLDMPWAKNNLSRYEYIVHVINHSTFHRGQIVTIARNLGIKTGIPNTDYNIYNTQNHE